jgi:hypothetical protein
MPFNFERSTVNVKEFLSVIDLTNINQFKINNEVLSLTYIQTVLSQYDIDTVEINTNFMPLTTKDIHTIILSDNIDDAVQYLNTETHLPNSPSYISISINIKLKERRK